MHPVSKVSAARRLGLFTREEARKSGLTDDQIRLRLVRGDWQAVFRSVLAPAGLRVTPEVRDVSAYLAVPDAVLGGPSAARTYDIPVPDNGTYLVVPRGRRVRLAGVRALCWPLGPREVGRYEGMRVCSRDRAVVDCLRLLPDTEATSFLDRALQQRWLTLAELVAATNRSAGRPGARRLVQLVRQAAGGTRSHAERVLVAELRQRRVSGWQAGHPVVAGGRRIAEVDLAFPAVRLAVEVDGQAFHITPDRFEGDRSRQNQLVGAGWTVLRFTWADLTRRPDHVVATIKSTFARLERP